VESLDDGSHENIRHIGDVMQIESLRKIVQDVDAAPNLHAALEVMVHLVAEAMETEVCSVYLLDERNQRYILMASVGLNPDADRSGGATRRNYQP
jgi:phosphotransferase system enzyme I (PtsP)